MFSEEEQWKERQITDEHKETFRSEQNVPYFDHIDGFPGYPINKCGSLYINYHL